MKYYYSSLLQIFFITITLYSCSNSCSTNTEVPNKDITILIQKAENNKLSDDLIELSLPFEYNGNIEGSSIRADFFISSTIRRIDIDSVDYKIATVQEKMGIGLTASAAAENLRNELKEKGKLPNNFLSPPSVIYFAKDYINKISQNKQKDTTYVILFGKTEGLSFLAKEPMFVIVSANNIDDFRTKFANFFIRNRNSNANVVVLYNVKLNVDNPPQDTVSIPTVEQEFGRIIKEKTDSLKTAKSEIKKLKENIQTLKDNGGNPRTISNLQNQLSIKNNELDRLKNEITALNRKVKELEDENRGQKRTISVQKDEIEDLTAHNTTLIKETATEIEKRKEAEVEKIKSDIKGHLKEGKFGTRLITLNENGDIQFWKEKGGGKLEKMTMWNTKTATYEERRAAYKKMVCTSYGQAYKLAELHNIMLEDVKGEAEERRKVYYELVKKAKYDGEMTYNNVVDFLKACINQYAN